MCATANAGAMGEGDLGFAELRRLAILLSTQPGRLLAEVRGRTSLMLLIANIAAQSLSVGLSPVLSRLYTPEAFGILGALSGLVVIVQPMISLRYELGIPRAEGEQGSATMLALCGLSIFGMGLASLGLTCLVLQAVHSVWLEPLRPYLYFVSIAACATAAFETLVMESTRRGVLAPLATARLMQSGLGVSAQLVLGGMGWGPGGLLVGFLINQAAGISRLFRALVLLHSGHRPRFREILNAAFEQRAFPLYASWAASLDACARWGLQLLITSFWDPKIGGFLFLADRVVGRPLQLVSTALLPVYVSRFSSALAEAPHEVTGIFFRTLRRQAAVCCGWTLLVVCAAPLTFGSLFGQEWAEAVPYVQVMSLALIAGNLLNPVSHTLNLIQRQHLDSLLSIARTTSTVAAIGVSYLHGESAFFALVTFAVLQSVFGAIRYAFFVWGVRTVSRAHLDRC